MLTLNNESGVVFAHREPRPEDYMPKGGIEDDWWDKSKNTRPTGQSGGIEDVTRTRKSTNNTPNPAKEYKLVVAAIDFGTTYSGYAYAFRDILDDDFTKVYCHTWKSQRGKNTVSHKTPTSVLLNQAGEFVAFGFEAEEKYEELANDNLHLDFRFFRRFKMELHKNDGLKRDTTLKDGQGNEMRAIDVFAHAIGYMKNHLITNLEDKKCAIRKEEIKWVITIPAIWDPRSKQFMREAAELGGILDHQLEFALEPEAASVFLKEVRTERSTQEAETKRAALTAFPPGIKYLVLDLGGGTIDITARMVIEDGKLRELHHATGNNHGGNSINEQIWDYLDELLGSNVMSKFKNDTQYTADYFDLDMEIETKKRTVQSELETQKNLTLYLPASLLELFEEINDKELATHLKGEKNMILKGNKLRFNFDTVNKFFQKTLGFIIKDTKKVLQHKDCQDITKIMLVGGFAESKIVSESIRKAFEEFSKIKVVIPQEPGLAVLRGAVIYRHWPEVVSFRKCPYTYGSRLMRYFLKHYDDENKLKMVRGQPVCLDVFGKFVTVGTEFQTNQTCNTLEVFPLRPEDTEMTVFIYKTDAEDAKYVTDYGCTYLGKIKVDMPDTTGGLDRKVNLTLTLGHTEIIVKGKHWPNGNEATLTFDWLS